MTSTTTATYLTPLGLSLPFLFISSSVVCLTIQNSKVRNRIAVKSKTESNQFRGFLGGNQTKLKAKNQFSRPLTYMYYF